MTKESDCEMLVRFTRLKLLSAPEDFVKSLLYSIRSSKPMPWHISNV